MHASLIFVGLGAIAAQVLAGGIDTFYDTTVVTITSCGPEVDNCPGKTSTPTTTEVTETSTYCPPTVSVATIATSVVVPVTPTTAPIVAPTYPASIPSASSITVQVSEAPSTPPATPVTITSSNLTSIATYPASIIADSSTSSPAEVTSAPVGHPTYSNSTLTAPTLPGSETGIIAASGTPTAPIQSTLTSVVIVPPAPSSTTGESSSGSATSAPPSSTGAAGRMVVPGCMLGLIAVGAVILG